MDLVAVIKSWCGCFVDILLNTNLSVPEAVKQSDAMFPTASPHLRVRSSEFLFNAHGEQERLTFGSLERVHSRTVRAAERIPFDLVKRVAKVEERLRMQKGAYDGSDEIPDASVEDDMTARALYEVFEIPATPQHVTLYRIAVRLHQTALQNDIVYLRADASLPTMFCPGDTVPDLPFMGGRRMTESGMWLFLSAS